MEEIDKNRKQIDLIDRQILLLLAKRMAVAAKIGSFKEKYHLKIKDLKRERQAMKVRLAAAKKQNLPAGFIRKLFSLIISRSREIQSR